MGFFDKIFGGKSTNQPNIKFGRYSDAYRSDAQQISFNKAIEEFEKGRYVRAYKYFFEFLRDDEADNVRFWEDEKGLRFELLQGSKKVIGIIFIWPNYSS